MVGRFTRPWPGTLLPDVALAVEAVAVCTGRVWVGDMEVVVRCMTVARENTISGAADPFKHYP